jgi:ABC-type branched-subunit amino acid transport system ATPase component/ABC-type branched-subunit amino acid transport system permease subunit
MSQHIVFLLLGLGNGAVFAALAIALVITYRSSGVVNFATGAIALYVAYTYAFLREGQFLVPIPGLPVTVDLGGPMSFWPAFVIALVVAAVFGLLLYFVVFRPLRSAPPVAKAVASIGVTVVMQGVLAQRVGTLPVVVDQILPTGTVEIFGARVQTDRLWLTAAIVGVTVVLVAAFRFTRFGLVTRAAAENEKGALVTGLSPDRVAMANWAIGAVVAGISGILISPIVPLLPISYTLFIVPALAAALAARFSNLGIAVIAGLAIGMIQSELVFLHAQHQWLPETGLAELVPLVLILGYLVLRGRPLPSRGELIQQTLGRAPRPHGVLIPTLVGVAAGVGALLLTHGSYRAALISTFIFGVITLSLVVVTGFAGQVSLAQLTLAGVGGFMLSRLTTQWGVPFPLAPLLAATAAMVIGVVIGLPALRIRGLSVAVVTLTLAVTLEAFWFRNGDLNGGLNGAPVSGPTLFGLDLRGQVGAHFARLEFGLLCLVVLTVVALGVAWLRSSRLGAAMLAVRANERSAAAAGVNVATTKIVAFGIAAFIAGLGGTLLAYDQTGAAATSYSAIIGLGLFATAYLAGITSVSGGIVAGVIAAGGIFYLLLDRLISLGNWYATLSGVGLILTVILNPEGLVGPMHELAARLRLRRAAPPPPEAAPSPVLATQGTAGAPVGAADQPPLLAVRDLSVHYGSVVAVDDVSLTVGAHAIVGLIGPNGAGKTTLIDAVSGFADSEGAVELDGHSLVGLRSHQRIRAGLGRTFQGIELYEDMSVAENVLVGETASRSGRAKALRSAEVAPELDDVYELLGLEDVRDRPVGELSQGYRQLVSIARALAGRPRVVLLDEPAGGLDSTESEWLGERIHRVRSSGVSVLLVDHDMSLVLGVCDVIHVLDVGRLIASGTPAQIQTDPVVASAYLGTTHARQESDG